MSNAEEMWVDWRFLGQDLSRNLQLVRLLARGVGTADVVDLKVWRNPAGKRGKGPAGSDVARDTGPKTLREGNSRKVAVC